MSHPLIDRLPDELGWPRLSNDSDVAEFKNRPGVHVLFIPGDPARNLESADVAVILPELKMAFQGRFDCALVDDAIETQVREQAQVFKTPSLIFYRDGAQIGSIPKVRDWSEYMVRIEQILSIAVAAE